MKQTSSVDGEKNVSLKNGPLMNSTAPRKRKPTSKIASIFFFFNRLGTDILSNTLNPLWLSRRCRSNMRSLLPSSKNKRNSTKGKAMVTISLLYSLKYINYSEKLNTDKYLQKAMKNLIFPRARLCSPTPKPKCYSKMFLSIKVFFFFSSLL